MNKIVLYAIIILSVLTIELSIVCNAINSIEKTGNELNSITNKIQFNVN